MDEIKNIPKVEPKVEPKGKVDVAKFKERKLKLINAMADKAKAKFLAEQVSRY